MRRALATLALLAALVSPGFDTSALAVEPSEMLRDPGLEARARSISEGLRCLVCQNESIDDSHAELAADIRQLVRRRLVDGDSDTQVRDYLVARYGQFILLKPPFEAQTLLLWGTPLIALALGLAGIAFAARRASTQRRPSAPLSPAERRRLDELLGQDAGATPGGATKAG